MGYKVIAIKDMKSTGTRVNQDVDDSDDVIFVKITRTADEKEKTIDREPPAPIEEEAAGGFVANEMTQETLDFLMKKSTSTKPMARTDKKAGAPVDPERNSLEKLADAAEMLEVYDDVGNDTGYTTKDGSFIRFESIAGYRFEHWGVINDGRVVDYTTLPPSYMSMHLTDKTDMSGAVGAAVGGGESAPAGEGESASVGGGESAPAGEGESASVGEGESAPAGETESASVGGDESAPVGEAKSTPAVEGKSGKRKRKGGKETPTKATKTPAELGEAKRRTEEARLKRYEQARKEAEQAALACGSSIRIPKPTALVVGSTRSNASSQEEKTQAKVDAGKIRLVPSPAKKGKGRN